MNKLVSIIVPVYNAAPFLRECIDSLLWQDYIQIEIILIDDGSTDDSFDICKSYANNDLRIRTLSIRNGGVSNARNVGLDMAKGSMIAFVDSDDIVTQNYVSSLVNCMEEHNTDIVCANILQWNPVDDMVIPFPGSKNSLKALKLSSDEAIENMLRNRCISSGPYAKLISKSIIKDERFSKLIIAEDLEFNFKVFSKAKEIIYFDCDVYKYRQNTTGAMRKAFKPERMDAILATDSILSVATEHNKIYLKAARYRLIRAALHCAGSILDSSREGEYRNYYHRCRSLIRTHALAVVFDSKADIKMRTISILAAVNLHLAWKVTSVWHKFDIKLKAIRLKVKDGAF